MTARRPGPQRWPVTSGTRRAGPGAGASTRLRHDPPSMHTASVGRAPLAAQGAARGHAASSISDLARQAHESTRS